MPLDNSAPAELAALLPEFEFLRELGRGGAAIVYLARDRELGREVAVKIVRDRFLDDAETAARLAREARTVARLLHPNIVAVHGARRLSNGGLALVMQHIPGRTLKQVIRDQGPLPFALVEQVLRDVAAALMHAHHHRVIHRDIKPENIYLHEESGRALLADFGIAKPIDGENSLTLNGTVIGTPAYMSPEQVDGRAVDGRGDLYSLGLVAYEMITGKRPWEGENLYSIIYKQKHEELPPLLMHRPDTPAALQATVEGALRKDRDQRWSGVAEFAARLAAANGVSEPAITLATNHLAASAATPADAREEEDEAAHTIRYRRPEPDILLSPPETLPAEVQEPVAAMAPTRPVETELHAGPARRVRRRRRVRRMPPVRRVVGAAVVLILGAGATFLARTGMATRVPGVEALGTALFERDDATVRTVPTPTPPRAEPEPSVAAVSDGADRPDSVPVPVAPVPAPAPAPAPEPQTKPAPKPAAPAMTPQPRREAPQTPVARPSTGTEIAAGAPRLADPRVEVRPAPQPALAVEREAVPSLTPVTVGPRLRNRSAVEATLLTSLPQAPSAATSVSLWVLVSAQGRVRDTRLNGSSGDGTVDAAAQRAARRMEFDPGAGQTGPVWVNVALRLPGS